MKSWDDRVGELEQLAYVDEADSWEVDRTGIFRDPKTGKLALLTASGCSCWDGEFFEEQHATLAALAAALLTTDRTHNPTLKGAEALVAEARAALRKRRKA